MRKDRRLKEREIPLDPVYNSKIVAKVINKVMWDGKKKLAQRIVYEAFEIVRKESKTDPLKVFTTALKNISPTIELKTRKIGGANYQIPAEATPKRKEILALRWLVNYARARSERTIAEALAREILDAYKNVGASIKKRNEIIKTAESNKAFAYFRF